MPKPKHVTISESYELKAKSLKKGHTLWVGTRVFTVKRVEKLDSDYNMRNIHLVWGSGNPKDDVYLMVPAKMRFHVKTHKHIHTK